MTFKSDIAVYVIITGLISFGVWTITVGMETESAEQILEAQKVADNWRELDESQTNCGEIRGKIISLSDETFSGKELIIEALNEKYEEMEC